ncbi:MAG: invasion associated locus B family protein [Gammaproteobacteria bacterium]|nr:invasion associated locus B family protein [Gammaproteobacteria bacterium]
MNAIKYASVGAILSLAAVMPNAYAVKNGQKFKSWKGQCETVQKQKICGITQTILDADKKPVVNIFIRKVKGQKDPIAFVKVPLGVNLQAGLGLAVDKKEIAQIPYTVCDPAGCNAIFPLTSDAITKMKKGSNIQFGMLVINKEIVIKGSLSGFSKAVGSL